MTSQESYIIAADVILIIHFLFVFFIIGGLVCIIIGKFLAWAWVHHAGFRLVHLGGICIVVIQAWMGEICFLTNWEMALRQKGGEATYSGAFIAHWVESLLYYQAPTWVFTLCYSIFALAVIASWFWVKPEFKGSK